MLATVVLWAIVVYVKNQGKTTWYILIPAAFMTAVVTTYILVAPEGFSLDYNLSLIVGVSVAVILSLWFAFSKNFES